MKMWRRLFFYAAGVCFAASIIIMGIGVSRAQQTSDYFEQARIAIPFIRWGSLLSLLALLLSFFGRGAGRLIGILLSALFFAWWLLIAESIY
jgi:peptidoglycan/LPS O-acetylase OafA/YrhL